MITYNCPKCGSNVPLKESCSKCASKTEEQIKYKQQFHIPLYVFFVAFAIFAIGIVGVISFQQYKEQGVERKKQLSREQPHSISKDNSISVSSATHSEVAQVASEEKYEDPNMNLGYDDGYKYGYHRGYLDGKRQDEFEPYLPKAANVRLYTEEYRRGYAMGYSFGYEDGELELKEALADNEEFIDYDEDVIYEEYDIDYDY